MNQKIISYRNLESKIKEFKKQNKKIVTYNGSFDILHIGHLRSIEEAKKQGDNLIILLNSDVSVKLYKGPKRPIIDEDNRADMLAGLCAVNYIVLFDEINPKKILEKIRPAVHCSGSDWGKNCIERSVVESNGGKIHVLKWQKGFSTTNIIQKIFKAYGAPPIRAVFMDRDGVINDNKEGYIYKKEDFTFLPNVISALKKLSKTDYLLFIVTNQSGIARGKYSHDDLDKLNKWLIQTLKEENIKISKIYHCPHHPDENCECRKPKIGLFLQAVKEFGVSLDKSWLIGDRESDVIAGREANIKTIKIGEKMDSSFKLEPNFYVKDLLHAVNFISQ